MCLFKKILIILILPTKANAAIINNPTGGPASTGQDVINLITRLQGIVLDVAGAIAVAMIIWGAVLLTTAGGNEDRVGKGKKILKYAIGGLIFIILSRILITAYIEILGGSVNP